LLHLVFPGDIVNHPYAQGIVAVAAQLRHAFVFDREFIREGEPFLAAALGPRVE
jgi:hypothetical protein